MDYSAFRHSFAKDGVVLALHVEGGNQRRRERPLKYEPIVRLKTANFSTLARLAATKAAAAAAAASWRVRVRHALARQSWFS